MSQGKGPQSTRKVLARIEFTDEQKKLIASVAGREIAAANIVELGEEEAKRLAPGVISAAAVVMCW